MEWVVYIFLIIVCVFLSLFLVFIVEGKKVVSNAVETGNALTGEIHKLNSQIAVIVTNQGFVQDELKEHREYIKAVAETQNKMQKELLLKADKSELTELEKRMIENDHKTAMDFKYIENRVDRLIK